MKLNIQTRILFRQYYINWNILHVDFRPSIKFSYLDIHVSPRWRKLVSFRLVILILDPASQQNAANILFLWGMNLVSTYIYELHEFQWILWKLILGRAHSWKLINTRKRKSQTIVNLVIQYILQSNTLTR